MNEARIAGLRQNLGWTQERLATESGIGVRTVQRLEAGHDASLETLALIAGALHVSVRDLFATVDGQPFSDRIDSLADRVRDQQASRDRTSAAWRSLYIGVGIVVSVFGLFIGQYGMPMMISYWLGGFVILKALRTLVLEPRLDQRYPLSRSSQRQKALQPSAEFELVETRR